MVSRSPSGMASSSRANFVERAAASSAAASRPRSVSVSRLTRPSPLDRPRRTQPRPSNCLTSRLTVLFSSTGNAGPLGG